MGSAENSDKLKSSRPAMKRRKFFLLFGASAIGLAALSRSPLKLIGSLFNKSGRAAAGQAGSKDKNAGITVKQNPHSVKRAPRNG